MLPCSIRTLRQLAVVVVAACGGGHASTVDASEPVDARPKPAGCDWGELDDRGNDITQHTGVAEPTDVGFQTRAVLCGAIDTGHRDATSGAVDLDAYRVAITADTDVLVTLTGAGLESLARVRLSAFDVGSQQAVATASFVGDHGVFAAHLPAGNDDIAVVAEDGADLAAPIAYRIVLATDAPQTRCATATATADYTEAADGAANDGNDVIAIDYSATPNIALTAATTDAPEPTALAIASATTRRISGTSALTAVHGSYIDRDTYAIATGPTANQLSLRVGWPGLPDAATDLDVFLFAVDDVLPIGGAARSSTSGPEFQTFAVRPNMTYWMWIGAFSGSTGQPLTYDVTLCGETFAP